MLLTPDNVQNECVFSPCRIYRSGHVREMLEAHDLTLHALWFNGTWFGGYEPAHPLYLKNTLTPQEFR